MTRVARRLQHAEGLCYHAFSRGHNRQTIFHDDADRAAFVERIATAKKRFRFRLHHWCLMGNHYHLVLRVRDSRSPGWDWPIPAAAMAAMAPHPTPGCCARLPAP